CGLWHGPAWGYIIWGGLHGLALSGEKLFRDRRRARGLDVDGRQGWFGAVIGWAATLTFCVLARVFFQSPGLEHAGAYVTGLLTFDRPLYAFEPGVLAGTMLAIGLNFFGRPIFEGFVRWHERLSTVSRFAAWSAIALVLLTLRPFDVAFTVYFR